MHCDGDSEGSSYKKDTWQFLKRRDYTGRKDKAKEGDWGRLGHFEEGSDSCRGQATTLPMARRVDSAILRQDRILSQRYCNEIGRP